MTDEQKEPTALDTQESIVAKAAWVAELLPGRGFDHTTYAEASHALLVEIPYLVGELVQSLADRLAALEGDKKRLDWYANHNGFVVKYTAPDKTVQWQINNVRYPSLREAIDAAMSPPDQRKGDASG